ncbi:hypothetical protein [Streptomyces djakartensis]|uniref:Uncharacterized protein n=1 Tax=Streptomyces djakartensis TaxID=68193 RepID=A0ABQ2ZKV3_9ACTN|nr:hypothetical protein [Streptomyces djakartensis]GGY16124.1 hypothetical protein GCM10010384_22660 [Streptomyces djakartensis]
MRTEFELTRDGDDFVARLDPSQVSALEEALSYARRGDASDAYLRVLLGVGRDVVDGLVHRLRGPHTEPLDIRLRPEELHAALSALTNAAAHFVSADGRFSQEPFLIRLGFYRENFDALALAIVNAAYRAYEVRTDEVTE